MSAHCDKCGNDLVYAEEWPAMECPVCSLRAELVATREERDRLREALERIATIGEAQRPNDPGGRCGAIARAALAAGEETAE